MNKELDWQKLDIIRLFLLDREEEFSNHIEEFGYDSAEAKQLQEEILQILWGKMEEVS
jgi:hypothetical protein